MIGKTIPLRYILLGWKREDVKWEKWIGKGKCDSSFSSCVEKWENENWRKEEGEKKCHSSLFTEVNRKRKKSGLDGVFYLNLPFFFPYKEKRKENNIDKKKIKKKV